ncbi:MAG TPA: cytochrome c, partial [Nitrospinota bacterium]|nr:cytochrome c [Nitrospinota bacterium]
MVVFSVLGGLFCIYGYLVIRSLLWSPSFYIKNYTSEKSKVVISNLTSTEENQINYEGLSDIEKGRFLFNHRGCIICHGKDAKGGVRNPNSQSGEEIPALVYVREGYTKEELIERIKGGIPVVAKKDTDKSEPPINMPPWKDKLTDEEIGNIV